jgi:hypothetical protein
MLDRKLRRVQKMVQKANRSLPLWRKHELRNSLEDNGLEYLGSGCYAHVYAIDETRVLKILYSVDEGYERFVRKTRRSYNPFLPRVLYSGNWGGLRVFVLERLDLDEGSERTMDFIAALEYMKNANGENRWLAPVNQDLHRLVAWLNDEDLMNDIHAGNIMWRGDQPVITDPAT